MNIRWTEEATTSLEQISLYIAEDLQAALDQFALIAADLAKKI